MNVILSFSLSGGAKVLMSRNFRPRVFNPVNPVNPVKKKFVHDTESQFYALSFAPRSAPAISPLDSAFSLQPLISWYLFELFPWTTNVPPPHVWSSRMITQKVSSLTRNERGKFDQAIASLQNSVLSPILPPFFTQNAGLSFSRCFV